MSHLDFKLLLVPISIFCLLLTVPAIAVYYSFLHFLLILRICYYFCFIIYSYLYFTKICFILLFTNFINVILYRLYSMYYEIILLGISSLVVFSRIHNPLFRTLLIRLFEVKARKRIICLKVAISEMRLSLDGG